MSEASKKLVADRDAIIAALQMELDAINEQYAALCRHHIIVEKELVALKGAKK